MFYDEKLMGWGGEESIDCVEAGWGEVYMKFFNNKNFEEIKRAWSRIKLKNNSDEVPRDRVEVSLARDKLPSSRGDVMVP